jgi:hypothetical protein
MNTYKVIIFVCHTPWPGIIFCGAIIGTGADIWDVFCLTIAELLNISQILTASQHSNDAVYPGKSS